MKLIIDIPENIFIKDDLIHFFGCYSQKLYEVIKDGTPLEDVLDKLRAEIQENINYNKKMNYQGIVAGLLLTLDIIDKYKGEQE